MKRRDFLKNTGKGVALAAACGGAGFFFHNRQSNAYQKLIAAAADYRVGKIADLPGLVLARNENHTAALNSSLDAIGGIKRFIASGDRVVIKPNVGWDRTPEQAADTNPLLVGEMVRLCLAAGAAEVIVSDVSCNHPPRCFIRSGIRDAVEKAGGKVELPGDEDFVKTDINGKMLTVWPVLKYFMECDKFINMPIAKHHGLSRYTGGMKNLYGILGGSRGQLHQQIDQSIVDLASFCRPTLTVIDATRVLLRNGPTGGSLDDVAIENTVLCATDPVAADARAAEFVNMVPDKIGHIALAHSSGLGEIDYKAAGYKEIIS